MKPEDVLDLLETLERKRTDERMFMRWIVGPQFEVSFEEFKRQLEPPKSRDDDEILAEVYALFGEKYGA